MDKKYFIKDESLKSIDNDSFQYKDLSIVLNKAIDTNESPFNIAIIGSWGLGKSSLINMALTPFKSRKDYIVHEINAWKYEKESLRRVFLKQLYQKVTGESVLSIQSLKKLVDNNLTKNYEQLKQNSQENINAKKGFKYHWNRLLSNIKKDSIIEAIIMFSILMIVSVLGFVFYKYIGGIISLQKPTILEIIHSYMRNFGKIVWAPLVLAIGKIGLDTINSQQQSKVEINLPLETTDDYELLLEQSIEKKLEKNNNLKIITVIDDLDRLSLNKIVEALDAIKAFLDFKNCIFIVPFDDEIIKKALEKGRIDELNGDVEVIESELVLDKLFQFKLFLPPLLKYNIKEYAITLVQKAIPTFIIEYCELKMFEDVIKTILIHEGVKTPRDVKKIINAFVTNYMFAKQRESSKAVAQDVFSSAIGVKQIAKISVLQADFNEFYDLFIKDYTLVDKLLYYHENNEYPQEPELHNYFEKINDIGKIKEKHEPLVNFLSSTRYYDAQNIQPYIFMAQSELSISTGDAVQQRLLNALRSNNITTAVSVIEEHPNAVDIIAYNIDNNPPETVIEEAPAIINLFSYLLEEKQKLLSDLIVDKYPTYNTYNIFSNTNHKNICMIFEKTANKEYGNNFINLYLKFLINEDLFSAVAIKSLIAIETQLSKENKNSLQDYITASIKSHDTVDEILDSFNDIDEDVFKEYFADDWLDALVDYASDNGLNDNSKKYLLDVVNQLYKKDNINEVFEHLEKLSGHSSYYKFLNGLLDSELASAVTEKNATFISEKMIELADKINENDIFDLLEKLNYKITEDNFELFDSFIQANIENERIQLLLKKAVTDNRISNLKDTKKTLIDEVINSHPDVYHTYDECFEIIQSQFSDEDRENIKVKLNPLIVHNLNDYTRVQQIVNILSKSISNKSIIDNIGTVVLQQNRSHWPNTIVYVPFMEYVFIELQKSLDDTSLNVFWKYILSNIENNSTKVITLLNKLGVIPENYFEEIWKIVLDDKFINDFDAIHDFIVINDENRDSEGENLTKYKAFLVNGISNSNQPNTILRTISNSFSYVSSYSELVNNALINEDTEIKTLSDVIYKSVNNKEYIDNVSTNIIKSFDSTKKYDLWKIVLDRIGEADRKTIISSVIVIEHSDDISIVKNIWRFTLEYKNIISVEDILISFRNTVTFNNVELASKTINEFIKLNLFSKKENKDSVAETFFHSFRETPSDTIKEKITKSISEMKIVKQYKKRLNEEEKQYYESLN